MEQTLILILEVLGLILVTVAIGYGGCKLFEFIKSKLKDGPFKTLISKIEEIFKSAIKLAYQTEVEALKNSGDFTIEKQQEVKGKVALRILEKLSPEQKVYIEENYGDVNKYVGDHIEEVIYNLKQEGKAI